MMTREVPMRGLICEKVIEAPEGVVAPADAI